MESSRVGVPEAHLEQFAKAKRQQQLIYDVTGNLISRIKTKLDELSLFEGIGSRSVQEKIDILEGRIESLISDLSRRKMKIAFFGGTSSGKTTTLNAIIGHELLPSGMGDTTSCFVQIEKMTSGVTGKDSTGDSNGYAEKDNSSARVKREDQQETSYFFVREVESREKEASLNSFMENKQPLNKNTLEELCDANSRRSLDATYLIEIHLSEDDVKEDHLLNYDLQIMDCPGITKCRELGDKVKAFCADSDVHVFIVNPKTVMSPEERDHFVAVGKRLPKPDIIVGFTQWDLSARERRPEEVKARHVDSVFEMLKELDVVNTREEAEERCFFYSGREALDLALDDKGFLIRGWEERFKTFQNFISKIEERATLAVIPTKLNLNRVTCQEVLHQCIESLSALEKRMQDKTSDFKNEIESMKSTLKSYDEKMAEFVKESEDLRTKALVKIDESISRCMAEVSDKMSQTLRINSDNDGFEEDQVHQFAERAILIWYRRILDEFQRATDNVCGDYSFDVRASYEKHMAMFPQDTPRAFLFDSQDEQEQPNSIPGSPIPRAAVQRVLSGINVRPVWASFASTRRRLCSVETDAERNALIRGMAAATGVFFMHVRQWIRVSVEQKLERLTTKEKDFLICPPIRVKCHEAVEIFCDNADGYYRETCIREVQEVLQTRKAKLKEKHSKMIQLSTDFVNLRAEADQIKCKDNKDDHMTEKSDEPVAPIVTM